MWRTLTHVDRSTLPAHVRRNVTRSTVGFVPENLVQNLYIDPTYKLLAHDLFHHQPTEKVVSWKMEFRALGAAYVAPGHRIWEDLNSPFPCTGLHSTMRTFVTLPKTDEQETTIDIPEKIRWWFHRHFQDNPVPYINLWANGYAYGRQFDPAIVQKMDRTKFEEFKECGKLAVNLLTGEIKVLDKLACV